MSPCAGAVCASVAARSPASRQQLRDVVRRHAPAADLDQRAGEDAHHVHHERVALHLEREQLGLRGVVLDQLDARAACAACSRACRPTARNARKSCVPGKRAHASRIAARSIAAARRAWSRCGAQAGALAEVPGARAQQRVARGAEVKQVAIGLVERVEARLVVGRRRLRRRAPRCPAAGSG